MKQDQSAPDSNNWLANTAPSQVQSQSQELGRIGFRSTTWNNTLVMRDQKVHEIIDDANSETNQQIQFGTWPKTDDNQISQNQLNIPANSAKNNQPNSFWNTTPSGTTSTLDPQLRQHGWGVNNNQKLQNNGNGWWFTNSTNQSLVSTQQG